MRYLLISEKPSLMRLVQGAYKQAHLPFSVDFMSLHGHCCTLCAPGDYKKEWEDWNVEQLPMIPDPFKHKPVEEPLVKEIKKQLKSVKYDGFINCTDAEREGQNIFYSLYDYLGSDLPVKRFWASDLTDEKLIEAWKNLKDDQHDKYLKDLTSAALLRANADWLVGMNFSRMVSLINNKNIPIGRVMTAVLAILAKREIDIKNFVPKTTYKIMVEYLEGFLGELDQEPFENKKDAEKLLKEIGKTATVKEFNIKKRKNEAPLLYSLGDLQNDANRDYGYSLADSLDIIQKLYEKKILSYPRTDCPYLTTGEGARMGEIVRACRCVPEVAKAKLDNSKITNYTSSKYVNDKKVEAHYAIVFTGKEFDFNGLTKSEQNICTLVAKRILATVMDNAEYSDLTLKACDNDKTFITKESVLVKAGWRILYGEKEKQLSIGSFKVGTKLNINKPYIKEVVSTCPPRFNDASLNKAMINVASLIEDKELASALQGKTKDQGGIGTPATRAGIVEKLLDPKKNWVERKGKNFIVTDKGLAVYEALKDYSVASPILTAQWEQKLKEVEMGEMKPETFTKELNNYVIEECENLKKVKVKGGDGSSNKATEINLKCPLCGASMKESGKYYYCSKYKDTCTFILGKNTSGASISIKDLTDLIEKNETKTKTFKSKAGKKFSAKLGIKDKKVSFIFEDNTPAETEIICKKCKKAVKMMKGKYGDYYKCSCDRTVSEKWLGHKFTQAELKKLYNNEIVLVKNLKSKKGNNFNANLKLDDKVSIESFEGEKE